LYLDTSSSSLVDSSGSYPDASGFGSLVDAPSPHSDCRKDFCFSREFMLMIISLGIPICRYSSGVGYLPRSVGRSSEPLHVPE